MASENGSATIQCTSAKPLSIVAPMSGSSCSPPFPLSLLFVAKETCRPDRHIDTRHATLPYSGSDSHTRSQGPWGTQTQRLHTSSSISLGCVQALAADTRASDKHIWLSSQFLPYQLIQDSVAAMIDSVQLSPHCPCSGFHIRLWPSFNLRKAVPDDHCWDRNTQCWGSPDLQSARIQIDVHDRQCTGRLSVENPGRLEMLR